ncbi:MULTISPECIES: phosphate ABC transporter permease subunit PstC [unclassified Alishewanella]|uniref:phosphate ABC transporter permease subunit PstC n=1 Tax=unclassified Alishewanella TaxID=2628974 RepID=UPI0008236173|nr:MULTISPECIES: phosphate ABC transporter permease subunit PstC [unclassified Alishewanella]MCT8127094.1 phosphate ABC transporter permease subunit PstC [Alishewanella sp. BS5-314]OCW93419.1 phosphate ABC transporter permease subunit PstC [Alishewanella sp. HH-ZS]
MNNLSLIIILLVLLAVAYQLGMQRSRKLAGGQNSASLHSRPHHYGMMVGLWAVLPPLFVMLLWNWFSPAVIQQLVLASLPAEVLNSGEQAQVILRRISNLATNFAVLSEAADWEISAANYLTALQQKSTLLLTALMFIIGALGLLVSYQKIRPSLRARHQVEKALMATLLICSTIAILTTIGIVLSMVGETLKFFSFIKPSDFFFGTTWNPRFSTAGVADGSLTGSQGSFGLLPLLSGTMLVAGIALLVAIPLGLMVAIYMAEYAPKKVRDTVKPIIEVLAGIPTIVYGFFALVVVGPYLADLGQMLGLTIRATSALTAGVVMGIMIIPFISSLSDDIITQVPKALRDGSLGLGATKSETIRKVVLPAALPGIVGAVLLAASRAIGETMIVVLAAGNSPSLTANPFEAVSTVTVTIVNQLTGDNDFASPQSLVAFALGLTLFVITLLLNIVALVIVRKYREQYE